MKKILKKIKQFFIDLKTAFLKAWFDLKTRLSQFWIKSKEKAKKTDKKPNSALKVIFILLSAVCIISPLKQCSKTSTAKADNNTDYIAVTCPSIVFDYLGSNQYVLINSYPFTIGTDNNSIYLEYSGNQSSGGNAIQSTKYVTTLTSSFQSIVVGGYYAISDGSVTSYGIQLKVRYYYYDTSRFNTSSFISKVVIAYRPNENHYKLVIHDDIGLILGLEIETNINTIGYCDYSVEVLNPTVYESNFTLGYNVGYDIGYSRGYNVGIGENENINTNVFTIIKNGVSEFMQIQIFEGLSMSTLIYIAFGIFALIILIKVFT